MPSTEMVRRFAGCDPNVPNEVLDGCLQAAVEWYARADVAQRTDSRLYDFWVCNLAAWFYDNRGASDANIPPFILASVHQLRESGVRQP